MLQKIELHPNYELIGPENTKIILSYSKNSKKIRLKFNIALQEFYLSAPFGISAYDVQYFIKRCHEWMVKQLKKPRIEILEFQVKSNEKISILGKQYTLLCKMDLKKSFIFDGDFIKISGPSSSFSSILNQSLRDLLQKILYQRCFVFSKKTGKKINKISIKEMKTRWGSCSSTGNLSFSWHLIFAPSPIIDYLCAHEVAHLTEMNHSKKFWDVVHSLDSNYIESRKWLKENGKSLMHIKI